jgi:hypothetical protein
VSETVCDDAAVRDNPWLLVSCNSAKKQKLDVVGKPMNMPKTVMATRTSKRVCKDGISIMKKAETRAAKRNEIAGNNPFIVLRSVPNEKLASLASNCGVVFEDNQANVDVHLDVL